MGGAFRCPTALSAAGGTVDDVPLHGCSGAGTPRPDPMRAGPASCIAGSVRRYGRRVSASRAREALHGRNDRGAQGRLSLARSTDEGSSFAGTESRLSLARGRPRFHKCGTAERGVSASRARAAPFPTCTARGTHILRTLLPDATRRRRSPPGVLTNEDPSASRPQGQLADGVCEVLRGPLSLAPAGVTLATASFDAVEGLSLARAGAAPWSAGWTCVMHAQPRARGRLRPRAG